MFPSEQISFLILNINLIQIEVPFKDLSILFIVEENLFYTGLFNITVLHCRMLLGKLIIILHRKWKIKVL